MALALRKGSRNLTLRSGLRRECSAQSSLVPAGGEAGTGGPAGWVPGWAPLSARAAPSLTHTVVPRRSHTGEKPFKCSQCGRGFVSAGVLKAHGRTHTGLKSFKCLVCNGAFTTGGSLRRHMGIHNDLRPYMCPYCQKTFKTSLNCKKHMKTHRYVSSGGPRAVAAASLEE